MAEIFPIVESIANLMPVVLLAVGGVFMIRGQLTMGDYVAFQASSGQSPIRCVRWEIS